MHRLSRRAGGIAAVLAVVGLITIAAFASSGSAAVATPKAQACSNFKVAVLDDDSHRSALYAIQKGIVKSPLIGKVSVSYLQIPALIQATGTNQYDVVETSLPGVVNARVRGHLDLRVIYIALAHTGGGIKAYVRADSKLTSPKQLVGKTVGTPSLGSTATIQAEIVWEKMYGINPKSIKFVELDPATLLNAVKTGHVDAALLWHLAGWMAMHDKSLKILDPIDKQYKQATGQWPVGAAFVVTGSELKAHTACIHAFQRMLLQSTAYVRHHLDAVAKTIAKETRENPAFIRYWWSGAYQFGGVNATWQKRAQVLFNTAARDGFVPKRLVLSSVFVPLSAK